MLHLISDASVSSKENNAGDAWQIYDKKDRKMTAMIPLENIKSHSYRHKLKTFHFMLKDTNRAINQTIEQRMDYKAALTILEQRTYKPKDNTKTYSDIIMSHRALMKELRYVIMNKWVEGHTHKRRRRT